MNAVVQMVANRFADHKYICIGLDPDLEKIPNYHHCKTDGERVYEFLTRIIDKTHKLALAYKPQSAYYEALGDEGHTVLRDVIAYIRDIDASIPVILDYKRGDIGRTNDPYVKLAFDPALYGADAVTVNPFLGMEAMEPFLVREDKLIIVLCRTSNEGAGEFQDVLCWPLMHKPSGQFFSTKAEMARELGIDENEFDKSDLLHMQMPLYEFVARRVALSWNSRGNCALVVGATYADKELKDIRRIAGDEMQLLLPGVGTQGADLEATILNGRAKEGWNIIINNASAILYAYEKRRGYTRGRAEFAARLAAQEMHNQITAVLEAA